MKLFARAVSAFVVLFLFSLAPVYAQQLKLSLYDDEGTPTSLYAVTVGKNYTFTTGHQGVELINPDDALRIVGVDDLSVQGCGWSALTQGTPTPVVTPQCKITVTRLPDEGNNRVWRLRWNSEGLTYLYIRQRYGTGPTQYSSYTTGSRATINTTPTVVVPTATAPVPTVAVPTATPTGLCLVCVPCK